MHFCWSASPCCCLICRSSVLYCPLGTTCPRNILWASRPFFFNSSRSIRCFSCSSLDNSFVMYTFGYPTSRSPNLFFNRYSASVSFSNLTISSLGLLSASFSAISLVLFRQKASVTFTLSLPECFNHLAHFCHIMILPSLWILTFALWNVVKNQVLGAVCFSWTAFFRAVELSPIFTSTLFMLSSTFLSITFSTRDLTSSTLFPMRASTSLSCFSTCTLMLWGVTRENC